jgi:hypothetical protein
MLFLGDGPALREKNTSNGDAGQGEVRIRETYADDRSDEERDFGINQKTQDDGPGKDSVHPQDFELERCHPIAPAIGQPTPADQLRA